MFPLNSVFCLASRQTRLPSPRAPRLRRCVRRLRRCVRRLRRRVRRLRRRVRRLRRRVRDGASLQ